MRLSHFKQFHFRSGHFGISSDIPITLLVKQGPAVVLGKGYPQTIFSHLDRAQIQKFECKLLPVEVTLGHVGTPQSLLFGYKDPSWSSDLRISRDYSREDEIILTLYSLIM